MKSHVLDNKAEEVESAHKLAELCDIGHTDTRKTLTRVFSVCTYTFQPPLCGVCDVGVTVVAF